MKDIGTCRQEKEKRDHGQYDAAKNRVPAPFTADRLQIVIQDVSGGIHFPLVGNNRDFIAVI